MQQPLNFTTPMNRDRSKPRRVDINRHHKRLLRKGWMNKSREIVCETRAELFSYKAPFSRKDGFKCPEVFNETATEARI